MLLDRPPRHLTHYVGGLPLLAACITRFRRDRDRDYGIVGAWITSMYIYSLCPDEKCYLNCFPLVEWFRLVNLLVSFVANPRGPLYTDERFHQLEGQQSNYKYKPYQPSFR